MAMFQTYSEALHYLYANLPVFQRVGAVAFRPDLANTRTLCDALGNPQNTFISIHIAGTNGKGSTSHMLASILQSAGYKTGLYTSPHLKEFTERIKVNGREVRQDFVPQFVNKTRDLIETIKPSFFEITVAMAFDYFAMEKVDVAIIETGLGGRLDSTNIITPVLSVITNIGWDHADLLGDSLDKIAFEKAGIIKPGVPVVIGERQPDIQDVFISKAKAGGAPIYFADDEYAVIAKTEMDLSSLQVTKKGVNYFNDVHFPLPGLYQRKNIPAVLRSIDELVKAGFTIHPDAILEGLQNVVSQTGLKGRWQKLGDKPLVICDTGHNVDGMREVVNQIRQQPYTRLFIVLGMVRDKDIDSVLKILPKEASYYFCQADIPRALDAEALAAKANAFGLKGVIKKNVNDALADAKRIAGSDDFIFIGGSTFVVAEINGL